MVVSEIWLFPNRRVYLAGFVLFALLAAGLLIGSLVAFWFGWWWLGGILCALSVAGFWLGGTLLAAMYRPRLAFGEEKLWVCFDRGKPIGVPIEIVECFFLGQGPSFLPEVQGKEPETQNIIVRLAESAVEWKHRDLEDDRFAHWCEGYITLRGAWCEPITRERMQMLNRRLAEIHRSRSARESSSS